MSLGLNAGILIALEPHPIEWVSVARLAARLAVTDAQISDAGEALVASGLARAKRHRVTGVITDLMIEPPEVRAPGELR